MAADRCLHICLLGDSGIGQSSFLRCYRDGHARAHAEEGTWLESLVVIVELEGEQFRVCFTDGAGQACLEVLRPAALGRAHCVLLCFSADSRESLAAVSGAWLPQLWAAGSEAPALLVGLRTDLRERGGGGCSAEAAAALARRHGLLGYVECSALFPETVQRVVDEALTAAREYYAVEWQLQPDPDGAAQRRRRSAEADAGDYRDSWASHERLTAKEDVRPLELEVVAKGLSTLGVTATGHHAYVRADLADLGLTSLDCIRNYKHLQFLNISRSQLRSLEPLGVLRSLLHLNASFNLLVRPHSFTAPDGLETVDMSYNLISELGDWAVHKYLRELNLQGNFISRIGPGLLRNKELRMLDLSENHLFRVENLGGLGITTLNLAQNRLASLEGTEGLAKLQVMTVRHNNIASLAALGADRTPMLRRLCLSENRITSIEEVARLEGFPQLCDLTLAPNPVLELPYVRAQVLRRLPCLRSLDGQPASAEEKVKADLIYGADVEPRRELFAQLLPDEVFEDRRLITRESIAAEEIATFGQEGDVGPFGRSALQAASSPLRRSQLQDAKFRQRLEQARRGGEPAGVADFANFAAPFASLYVTDEDLPEVLEAATEGFVEELLLGAAQLSPAGVLQVLAALQQARGALLHVDLAGCAAVEAAAAELLAKLPYASGRSLEVAGCGLSEQDEERLRNRTPEAERVRRRTAEERERMSSLVASYVAGMESEAPADEAADPRSQGAESLARQQLAKLVGSHFADVAEGREAVPAPELQELHHRLGKDMGHAVDYTRFLRILQRVLDESWRAPS